MSDDDELPPPRVRPKEHVERDLDPFKQAEAEGRDIEELQGLASRAQPRKFGLPITWEGRDDPVIIESSSSVVAPTDHEVSQYVTDAPREVCGSCRFFDQKLGRKKIIEERFAEKLVNEQGWRMEHLSVPPDSLGLCGRSDGMVTTIISKSCDQYRERDGRPGRWRL